MQGVRAFRGAVQLEQDDPQELLTAVKALLTEVLAVNGLSPDDLISIIFTATPDLRSAFPARAARELGITEVPLMCAQEIDVEGALPRTVRVLVTAESGLARSLVRHVYLGGARVLRADLAPAGRERVDAVGPGSR
ncbi:chorismate mutase [Kitasatospora sp. NBC_00315]|uniref:chorismate mutase n=1 Tax=Kitasatospora sp. NBC_00315 TaxID=2975963 RepID=UPI0032503314